jgi:26S proteasome regulatory subunit N4
MSSTAENSNNASKQLLLELDKKRRDIEKEIVELTDYLNQDGWPGVDKSLIDEQGFPLAGLDLYAIRDARQKLIHLQNDHKNLMLKIEELMSEYYKALKEATVITDTKKFEYKKNEEDLDKNLVQVFEDDDKEKKIKLPFAYISAVLKNSPAEEAGLIEGDGIYSFGNIKAYVSNPLEKIGALVRENENKEITLDIIRKNNFSTITLKLIPHKWDGNGLLGCKLNLK